MKIKTVVHGRNVEEFISYMKKQKLSCEKRLLERLLYLSRVKKGPVHFILIHENNVQESTGGTFAISANSYVTVEDLLYGPTASFTLEEARAMYVSKNPVLIDLAKKHYPESQLKIIESWKDLTLEERDKISEGRTEKTRLLNILLYIKNAGAYNNKAVSCVIVNGNTGFIVKPTHDKTVNPLFFHSMEDANRFIDKNKKLLTEYVNA